MRRMLMGMAMLAGVVLTVPRMAEARVPMWFGYPGVPIFGGPPVVPVPPVVVAPRPYYYGAYYAPPPYWRRPYYGYGPVYRGHKWKGRWKGRPPGWVKHGRW